MLKGILIALRRATSFSAAMHTAAFLAVYGRRLAGLSAPCLRAAPQAGQHRRGITRVAARHLFFDFRRAGIKAASLLSSKSGMGAVLASVNAGSVAVV